MPCQGRIRRSSSNEILLKEKPEYVVILAWHYADYIIRNWREKGLKSKFVIPLPNFSNR